MNFDKQLPNIEEDFFKLYYDWYSRIFSFIYLKTKSTELAEDVVQQTFLKVWERRNRFNEDCKFSSQLFQIARTTLIDDLRRQALSRRYADYEKPFLQRQYVNMESELTYRDELAYVKSLLQKMPLKRQQVFYMHKFEELSYKEISHKLAISPKTVENHISSAFKFIKKFHKIF